MSGKNSLKGAADLAIVHVQDVVTAHAKCMTVDSANGRYIVAPAQNTTFARSSGGKYCEQNTAWNLLESRFPSVVDCEAYCRADDACNA